MASRKNDYGNDSISSLKGADRVRKRPGVIFGSDGLDGCEHAVFEILSNSIDEAREGHGTLITVTRYADGSVEVEDAGRGCPVDWNEKEQRYNWELVYCELYAGGKYNNVDGDNYEYSLGLNGLGACATQYASRYMDVTVWREGTEYRLHFERGEIVGDLTKTPLPKSQARKTGTRTRWLPDLDVFTDIAIPAEYFTDVMKRQAVVNAGITFRFRNETEAGKFETTEFLYENGIADYVTELAGEGSLTAPVFWQTEKKGRDRADKPEYKVKLSVACCFSNKVSIIEHYHNSSWLEHGGSPEKAMRSAFLPTIPLLREEIARIGPVRRARFSYCQYSSRYDKFKAGEVLNAFNPALSNGALMDIGVYCVHPAALLFGMPKAVHASCVKLSNGVDGAGSALLEYDGMTAEVLYSKIADGALGSEFQGEAGSLVVDHISVPQELTLHLRKQPAEVLPTVHEVQSMRFEIAAFQRIAAGEEPCEEHTRASLITAQIMDEIRLQCGLHFPADVD